MMCFSSLKLVSDFFLESLCLSFLSLLLDILASPNNAASNPFVSAGFFDDDFFDFSSRLFRFCFRSTQKKKKLCNLHFCVSIR